MHCWRILKRQHKWGVFIEKVKNQPEDAAKDPKWLMGKKKVKAVEQSKKGRLDEDIDEGEGILMKAALLRERINLDRSHFKVLERTEYISIMDRDISTYTGTRLNFQTLAGRSHEEIF